MEPWILYALISTFFAGLTAVISKFGMQHISADLSITVRTIVVFVVITTNFFVLGQAKEIANLTPKAVLFLSISGITTSLSWIFYYRAIKIGPVSQVALIDKGSIIITLLLSFLFLQETFTLKTIIGASTVLGGLLILIL